MFIGIIDPQKWQWKREIENEGKIKTSVQLISSINFIEIDLTKKQSVDKVLLVKDKFNLLH